VAGANYIAEFEFIEKSIHFNAINIPGVIGSEKGILRNIGYKFARKNKKPPTSI
jgi:hypothetical protein